MGIDVMVVRHSSPGAPHLLAQHLNCSVINAGDGAHEHPTQGLLDIFTIRQLKGRLEGLTVGLVGDIAHSRVARSNIHGLLKLGARVIVCGPPTLVPRGIDRAGRRGVAPTSTTFCRAATWSTCCASSSSGSAAACSRRSTNTPACSAWTATGMRKAKPDMLLLAPGPINRGVEITPEVADGPHSAILQQVTNGLAVRMAVLYLLCGQPGEVSW